MCFLNLSLAAFFIIVSVSSTIHTKYDDMTTKQVLSFALITLVLGIVVLTLIWGVYQLIYGVLLRKLNRNYKELAKLDGLN